MKIFISEKPSITLSLMYLQEESGILKTLEICAIFERIMDAFSTTNWIDWIDFPTKKRLVRGDVYKSVV